MGRFVIAAYKSKPGKEDALLAAVRKHRHILLAENLISDKPTHLMRSTNGTIIEIFEWLSSAAVERAHANAAVKAVWAEFDAACDFVPIGRLAESQQMFSEFESLAL
jgi:hypothetical protein